jgi:FKBP-type peptidyl-prolyl cis-trans isomerase
MINRNSLRYYVFFPAITFLISFTSCDLSNKYYELEEKEKVLIQTYLADNDTLEFELKPSGLYYADIEVGTGLQAQIHDTAYVFYSMLSLTGELFESNAGTTDTLVFPVNEGVLSVAGFDEGMTYMRDGGKARFLVPSVLAFGPYGSSYIQGYTPLIFDVELVKLDKFSARK